MLACARIGAPHTVVFGGFSRRGAAATASTTPRPSWSSPPTAAGDAARRRPSSPPSTTRSRRPRRSTPHPRRPPRRRRARGRHRDAGRPRRVVARHRRAPERRRTSRSPVDSEHMLYLLYTSGTTAKPKGIIHTTAGYLLGTSFTHEMIFDIKPDDVYWCAADVGWVTGHSYIVYGPLANATTARAVRGHAGHARLGPLVADHRGLQGHDPVLRPDRHPRPHEAGPAVRRGPRPVQPARPGLASASRSIPRPGSGTTSTSAAARRPSSTRGGRPRRA